MRLLLMASGFAMLNFPLFAETSDTQDGSLEAESVYEERVTGWNQWVCFATAPGYYRPFMGASYFFREGSGEGQEARSLAHLSALRACEYYTGQRCGSRLESDCRVYRY